MISDVDADLAALGWNAGFPALREPEQVQVRRLFAHCRSEGIPVEKIERNDFSWDAYFDFRRRSSRSPASFKMSIRELEGALRKLTGRAWTHLGDGRTRKLPLPSLDAVVPQAYRAAVSLLAYHERRAATAFFAVAATHEAVLAAPSRERLDATLQWAQRFAVIESASDPTERTRFGKLLRHALRRLDPLLDLRVVTQFFGLPASNHLHACLPPARWPLAMQAAGIDLPERGINAIGRFLAYLEQNLLPLERIDEEVVLSYANAQDAQTASRPKIIASLTKYLVRVHPDSGAILREATRTLRSIHYGKSGRDYDRSQRNFRQRKQGWELGIPIDAWPAHFREPFRAYEARYRETGAKPDLLAAVLQAAPTADAPLLAPSHLGQTTRAVGQLLHDARRDQRVTIADELSLETVQVYIDAQRARGCRETTIAIRVKYLHSFACHVLGWPRAEREWLSLTWQSLSRSAKTGPRLKDAKRLPALGEIWSQGRELWRRAQVMGPGTQAAFRLARDGLVICFACNAPLRVSDMQPLEFWEDLFMRDGVWSLALNQIKGGDRYINSELWPEIGEMLDIYCERWLPDERRTNYVWMDRKPSEKWLSTVFANRLGINPHLIRDIVASALAAEGSEHAGAIPGLLGHADERTSEYYVRAAEMISGARTSRRLLAEMLDMLEDGDEPEA